nr:histidine kinase [uncultured Acetatifactor sp.]
MIRKLTQSYYAKISFICICIVSLVTGLFSYLCYGLISRQNVSEHLSDYNILINNQSSALSSRLASFSDFFHPVFSNPDAYKALCDLYLSPNGILPNETTDILLDTMSALCASDSYCCGMLLLTRTGRLYQYDTKYVSLIPLNLVRTTFRFTPYQLQLIPDSKISEMSLDMELPASHVYGLSGTLFRYKGNMLENLGYMIALYSTEEFSNILASSGLEDTAEFTIMNDSFSVIYSSAGDYASTDMEALLARPYKNVGGNVRLLSSPEGKCYFSSLPQNNYNYFTVYRLPAENIPVSTAQIMLLLLSLLLPLVCILLYSTVFRTSGRKVRNILTSMEIVGRNNLSYRMALPKGNDEFANIAHSFNHMCDELQKNVENVYLFEISQRKSELYAMQTSINPHFLYNALEQIRVQILHGNREKASRMLLLLSKMYRFQTKRNLFISIAEECAQMENLINLYSFRISECEYDIHVDNGVKKYGIPKNILQPLVENSFVHGFTPEQDNGLITITVTFSDTADTICFTVEDNGRSVTPEELEFLREKLLQPVLNRDEENGFALSNVNNRLKLVFGESACLNLSLGQGGAGFLVTFSIPPVLPEDLAASYSN